MDDKPATSANYITGQFYIWKATKDCASRCFKNVTKDLADSETNCLGKLKSYD